MLVFFAGKSTKAVQVAKDRSSVLISEDDWIESLYLGEIKSLKECAKYANRIKPIVKDIAQKILMSGGAVILDLPVNTINQRECLQSTLRCRLKMKALT